MNSKTMRSLRDVDRRIGGLEKNSFFVICIFMVDRRIGGLETSNC